jgi:hypothetical protein
MAAQWGDFIGFSLGRYKRSIRRLFAISKYRERIFVPSFLNHFPYPVSTSMRSMGLATIQLPCP